MEDQSYHGLDTHNFASRGVNRAGADLGTALVWIVLIIAVLIYNLYKLKTAKDPKDELLKAKRLLDEGVIEQSDYEKIKSKLMKRISE